MTQQGTKATLFNLAANIFLFIIKFMGVAITGSLALMSDAINSFSDSVYSIAIFFAVRVSHKGADADHPFGHHCAEPVASLLVALLAAILGFEIIKTGVFGLMAPEARTFSLIAVAILLVTMFLKAVMWLYFRSISIKIRSPALKAASVDCRNDVLVSFIAMLGVISLSTGFSNIDYYAAIAIGLFIIRSGYAIGVENVDYLMGKTAPKEILDEVRRRALSVNGVIDVHDVLAHYVGNYLHVQAHIVVDGRMETSKSHALSNRVTELIEGIEAVDKAFVHVDPRKER